MVLLRCLVWYCSCPLGHNTLENMPRSMTSRAGIKPHLTNHSIRATTMTVLSAANIENRYIRATTSHQSEESIMSYCDKSTFERFKRMSNKLSEFLDPPGGDDNAVTVPQKTVASSSSQLQSVATSTANYSFQSIQDGSQNLVHGFIPGATFHNCNLNFNVSFGGSSSK